MVFEEVGVVEGESDVGARGGGGVPSTSWVWAVVSLLHLQRCVGQKSVQASVHARRISDNVYGWCRLKSLERPDGRSCFVAVCSCGLRSQKRISRAGIWHFDRHRDSGAWAVEFYVPTAIRVWCMPCRSGRGALIQTRALVRPLDQMAVNLESKPASTAGGELHACSCSRSEGALLLQDRQVQGLFVEYERCCETIALYLPWTGRRRQGSGQRVQSGPRLSHSDGNLKRR